MLLLIITKELTMVKIYELLKALLLIVISDCSSEGLVFFSATADSSKVADINDEVILIYINGHFIVNEPEEVLSKGELPISHECLRKVLQDMVKGYELHKLSHIRLSKALQKALHADIHTRLIDAAFEELEDNDLLEINPKILAKIKE